VLKLQMPAKKMFAVSNPVVFHGPIVQMEVDVIINPSNLDTSEFPSMHAHLKKRHVVTRETKIRLMTNHSPIEEINVHKPIVVPGLIRRFFLDAGPLSGSCRSRPRGRLTPVSPEARLVAFCLNLTILLISSR